MARGQLSCKMRNSTAQHTGGNSKQKATHRGRDTLARGWQVFNPEASPHRAIGGALGRVASIMRASWILCAHASHSLRKPRHSCGGTPPPCCASLPAPVRGSAGTLKWPSQSSRIMSLSRAIVGAFPLLEIWFRKKSKISNYVFKNGPRNPCTWQSQRATLFFVCLQTVPRTHIGILGRWFYTTRIPGLRSWTHGVSLDMYQVWWLKFGLKTLSLFLLKLLGFGLHYPLGKDLRLPHI